MKAIYMGIHVCLFYDTFEKITERVESALKIKKNMN